MMMGNMSVVPNELPVSTLLALAADPLGFKAKIEELTTAVSEAHKVTEACQQAGTEADQKKTAADKATAEAKSAQEALNKRTALLDSRELEIIRREKDVDTRDQAYSAASAKNEADMRAREQAVGDKIDSVVNTLSDLL